MVYIYGRTCLYGKSYHGLASHSNHGEVHFIVFDLVNF